MAIIFGKVMSQYQGRWQDRAPRLLRADPGRGGRRGAGVRRGGAGGRAAEERELRAGGCATAAGGGRGVTAAHTPHGGLVANTRGGLFVC